MNRDDPEHHEDTIVAVSCLSDAPAAEHPSSDPASNKVVHFCADRDKLTKLDRALRQYIRRRTLESADVVEDLLQEVWTRAWSKRATFAGDNVEAWVFGVCRLVLLEYYRARTAKPGRLERFTVYLNQLGEDHCQSSEKELLSKEIFCILRQILLRMPEKMRDVFVMIEVDSMSHAETSEALGIKKGNVCIRLFRARTWLEEKLR